MPSDQFLDCLATDLKPVAPRRDSRDYLMLAGVGVVELALFLVLGAARPDIASAMALPPFWWKLGSLGVLTAVGAVTSVRSFYPASSPRRGLRVLAMLVGLSLMVGWGIDTLGEYAGPLAARLMWRHGILCAASMISLSIPPIIALGILMRRGAPTDRRGTALSVGATSAAWGAFVFVFNCPHDDPLNVAVWYSVGCSAVVLAGRLILPKITRW